ncbi:MAG: hypothetical protein JST33_05770 [Actinobacteria bacterium]|nr:hypothetical protein [Actinomycetota bacterium]
MTGDAPFAATTHDEESPTSNTEQTAEVDAADEPLPAVAPQQGYLGFTLRELILIGVWAVAFALSFVSGAGSILDSSATIWTMNGAWVLAIGVPTAALFLIVLRRLSPEGIRRVGSLGIDQFAAVAFSVALVSWVTLLWQQLDLVAATRRSPVLTWPLWLEIVLTLALVVATVFASLIPGLREDFEERMETLAHRNANPVRPVFTRPRPVRARGSISDPQNEDDVDPGLLHEGEVEAADHLSSGATGAAVPGAAGYIPEQHRESFLVSDAGPDDAPRAEAAPQETPVVDAPGDTALSDEAPTEAILDAAPDQVSAAAEPPAVPASESGEPATRAEARRSSAAPAGPSEDEVAAAGAGLGAEPVATSAPQDLSDTMTEVLGDLLAPSPVDEIATHAVDVVDESAAPQAQPFWALAPETRAVHDAQGDEIFTIGPDAWILVLEDRGGAYVVRHDDGRVGYLHDTENMTRG